MGQVDRRNDPYRIAASSSLTADPIEVLKQNDTINTATSIPSDPAGKVSTTKAPVFCLDSS